MLLRSSLVFSILFSLQANALDCEVSSRVPVESVVEYRSELNQLKVIASDQRLHALLDDVSRATGIEFIGDAGGCDSVTVDIEFLTMKAALSQLLKGRSYVVRQDAGEQTTQVWLLPVSETDSPTLEQIERDEFFRGLEATQDSEKLADQIRRLKNY